jgi:hypothetical protein
MGANFTLYRASLGGREAAFRATRRKRPTMAPLRPNTIAFKGQIGGTPSRRPLRTPFLETPSSRPPENVGRARRGVAVEGQAARGPCWGAANGRTIRPASLVKTQSICIETSDLGTSRRIRWNGSFAQTAVIPQRRQERRRVMALELGERRLLGLAAWHSRWMPHDALASF